MMSDHAWLVLILLCFSLYFIVSGLAVKTFRYKYGGFTVPRIIGGTIYVGLGVFFMWVAIVLAARS